MLLEMPMEKGLFQLNFWEKYYNTINITSPINNERKRDLMEKLNQFEYQEI